MGEKAGRITREFIAPGCVAAFRHLRRQVAAVYGLDPLPYVPGVPMGNEYPGDTPTP